MPTKEQVMDALNTVMDPELHRSLVELKMVRDLDIAADGTVSFTLVLTIPSCPLRNQMSADAERAIRELPGVTAVKVNFGSMTPEERKALMGDKMPLLPKLAELNKVGRMIAVMSGKGGVGKSTVAVNLALGLSRLGLKVGLLDLDLYGPSVPLMLGITGAQPGDNGDGRIAPVVAHGLKVLSIGFMVGADKALIWRGPILMKAVKQLLHEVAWEPLDILVLDLPPGTGDVQITMAQEVPVAGAVVVTTPQDVALVDAIKAVDMFNHTGAPVLGIVENMSYFVCPDCGGRHEIFGHGSVAPLSARLGVQFLGEIPLDQSVRQAMDAGAPIIQTDSAAAQAYRDLAARVLERIKAVRPGLEVA